MEEFWKHGKKQLASQRIWFPLFAVVIPLLFLCIAKTVFGILSSWNQTPAILPMPTESVATRDAPSFFPTQSFYQSSSGSFVKVIQGGSIRYVVYYPWYFESDSRCTQNIATWREDILIKLDTNKSLHLLRDSSDETRVRFNGNDVELQPRMFLLVRKDASIEVIPTSTILPVDCNDEAMRKVAERFIEKDPESGLKSTQ
jgi:hypothetical protein